MSVAVVGRMEDNRHWSGSHPLLTGQHSRLQALLVSGTHSRTPSTCTCSIGNMGNHDASLGYKRCLQLNIITLKERDKPPYVHVKASK